MSTPNNQSPSIPSPELAALHPVHSDPRLADPERLAFVGRRALARLQRSGRIDELRAAVSVIDAAVLAQLLDDEECEAQEGRERAARMDADARTAAAALEAQKAQKAERMSQLAQLWAGWLEERREEIEAHLSQPAPEELPQGETLWLVLDSNIAGRVGQTVIGIGERIGDAYRNALRESLWLCTPERLAESYEREPEGETLPDVLQRGVPGGYLRLSGDPKLIRGLLRAMDGGGCCAGGVAR